MYHLCTGTHASPKRASDVQELELQVFVRCFMWVLGTDPHVLCEGKQELLTAEPSLQPRLTHMLPGPAFLYSRTEVESRRSFRPRVGSQISRAVVILLLAAICSSRGVPIS